MINIDNMLLKVQKPARYTGGEVNSIVKDAKEVSLRIAFCFPDTYEIGMSHLGAKILYSLINSRSEYWCERCFMPLPDMEMLMRENSVPLYGIESMEPIADFDILAFTLQYELSYTTILAMLDLAGIPVLKSERDAAVGVSYPIVIAGGPCACNPMPLCDFIDIFVIGEGEEVTLELLDLFDKCKKSATLRDEFYAEAAKIEGVYVNGLTSRNPVKKRIVADLDSIFFPESFIVPFVEAVHERAVTEVLRGCIRGCRFCQAGFICRPYREKSGAKILNETVSLCESTGYDEVSLCSLSTSDHSDIEGLLTKLTDYTDKNSINLAFPSLRIDKFNEEVLRRIKSVRKSSLTFAPEAGTQRLRDVINKNITEEEILEGCRVAFSGGYSSVKLYFMLGLPTETDEDIVGIYTLTEKIMRLYKECGPNRGISVSISLATFVPKPFTPFQYEPMISRDEADRRQKLILSLFREKRKVKLSRSAYNTSFLEAVLARGDSRLGRVIYSVYKSRRDSSNKSISSALDSWDDYFDFSKWESAFNECKVDPVDIANRRRDYDEPLPWGGFDMLISAEHLIRENKRAHQGEVTPNCRESCSGCGVNLCVRDF
ncbi:MAG: TIGR03960 family B12-binding radical SAM protein [Oscillospiraceae bacterium]|nr:TIGR03960 family B12-binding radical SAM protein [Oscillospiraceae bacterium]